MSLHKKTSPATQFKFAGDTGTFTGYASTFGVIDQGGDIVVKGAYAKTLAQRGAQGIKLLIDHCGLPAGMWLDLREDDVGLVGTGKLLKGFPRMDEIHALMEIGAVDGLSIGYRVVNSARDASNGARLLQEIDLREISIVTFPMNETSLIASVKGELPTEREFERWLTQDAGFSRSQARTIITSGFKALPNAKPGAGEEGGDASRDAFDWAAIAAGLEGLRSTLKG
jgi:HK97 family phage prohead protease